MPRPRIGYEYQRPPVALALNGGLKPPAFPSGYTPLAESLIEELGGRPTVGQTPAEQKALIGQLQGLRQDRANTAALLKTPAWMGGMSNERRIQAPIAGVPPVNYERSAYATEGSMNPLSQRRISAMPHFEGQMDPGGVLGQMDAERNARVAAVRGRPEAVEAKKATEERNYQALVAGLRRGRASGALPRTFDPKTAPTSADPETTPTSPERRSLVRRFLENEQIANRKAQNAEVQRTGKGELVGVLTGRPQSTIDRQRREREAKRATLTEYKRTGQRVTPEMISAREALGGMLSREGGIGPQQYGPALAMAEFGGGDLRHTSPALAALSRVQADTDAKAAETAVAERAMRTQERIGAYDALSRAATPEAVGLINQRLRSLGEQAPSQPGVGAPPVAGGGGNMPIDPDAESLFNSTLKETGDPVKARQKVEVIYGTEEATDLFDRHQALHPPDTRPFTTKVEDTAASLVNQFGQVWDPRNIFPEENQRWDPLGRPLDPLFKILGLTKPPRTRATNTLAATDPKKARQETLPPLQGFWTGPGRALGRRIGIDEAYSNDMLYLPGLSDAEYDEYFKLLLSKQETSPRALKLWMKGRMGAGQSQKNGK